MLYREAKWIRDQFRNMPDDDIFPLLNVGSSTRELRERDQPWIDEQVFAPLRTRGGKILHQDLKQADGVDLVGDLDDPNFQTELRTLGIRSILCSNVLEHVPNPRRLAKTLREIIQPGAYLVVTVPRAFPYHPDPIDTRFRPSPEDLVALFSDVTTVCSEELPCGTAFGLLPGNVGRLARKAVELTQLRRQAGSRAEHHAGRANPIDWVWPHAIRPFVVTCAVMRAP